MSATDEVRRLPTAPVTHKVVGDLPGIRGRGPQVPQCRRELIAAALDNPGKWVHYTPGDLETVQHIASLKSMMSRCSGGFDRLGFQLSERRGEVYVRYNPDHPDLRVPAITIAGRQR